MSSAAFVDWYGISRLFGRNALYAPPYEWCSAPLLMMEMTLPERCWIIGRMKRRVTLSAPNTLTPNARSQSSSLVSSVVMRPVGGKRMRCRMAASLMTTSHVPHFANVSSYAASICSPFATSTVATSTSSGRPRRLSRNSVSLSLEKPDGSHDRSIATTLAPSARNACVNARPIPRAAPVIATTLPASSLISSLLGYRPRHARRAEDAPIILRAPTGRSPRVSGMVCAAHRPRQ